MTTTPNLPPLPDGDGYILITIAGRPVEVNGYRNSTMEAYALAAYQAGRNAGLEEAEAFLDARYKDALKRRDEAEDEPEFQAALTGEAFGHLQAILGLRNLKSDTKGGE